MCSHYSETMSVVVSRCSSGNFKHAWNQFTTLFSVTIVVTSVFISFGNHNVESLVIRENPVRVRVLEYNSKNGSLQRVLNSRYSDLVVGEEVEEQSQIVLECSSLLGPLRWIYSGDGEPRYKSYYSSTNNGHQVSYIAYLSFPNGLNGKETGQYTCQNSYNASVSNYAYLFVPLRNVNGKLSLFVPHGRRHDINLSPGENTTRIPCSVVHPNVKVSLERVSPKKSFWLDPPTRVPFSLKTGFTIPVSSTMKERFICRAEFNGEFEEVTYITSPQQPRIDSEAEYLYNIPQQTPTSFQNQTTQPTSSAALPAPEKNLMSACTPQFCGHNAECIVKDYNPYCICLEDYTGDAKTGCQRISDMSQHLRVENPCLPSPCGPHSECIEINGHPLCTCKQGYFGSPPDCQAHKFMNCTKNYDCEWTEYCNTETRECEDICEGSVKFCGKNAHCTAFSHMPYCTCPPGGGYIGDPYDTDGLGCQLQSERLQADGKPSCNPSPCGVNAHCKVYSSYPLPICFCPQGFTGDPTHRCYKVATSPIFDVFRPPNTPTPPSRPQPIRHPETPIRLCTTTTCGENARCRIRQNYPECHCLRGYKGDPYKGCRRTEISPSALRSACSVCGPNSVCSMVTSDVRCICAPETVGLPPHCQRIKKTNVNTHHIPQVHMITPITIVQNTKPNNTNSNNTCRSDLDCPDNKVCYTNINKCLNPCSWACSETANCTVVNHLPKCRCPNGFIGNPRINCIKKQQGINPPLPSPPYSTSVPDTHPCRFNCGPNTVCREVSNEEMRFLRRKALSMDALQMERDPFQRALLHYIANKHSNNNADNNYGDKQQKQGSFSECLCQPGTLGNPYGIEGCSVPDISNIGGGGDSSIISSSNNNYETIFSDDLEQSPSSSVIVVETDPCKPISPCGPHSLCVAFKGQAFCRCDYDSVGEPPSCMLRCALDQHCLFDQVCLHGKCVQMQQQSSHEDNSIFKK